MASATATSTTKEKVPFILKVKYSLYSALIFFLIANPQTFKLTQSITGINTASPQGFFLHTALFFIVILAFMMLPSS
jgi:hypothetical protein